MREVFLLILQIKLYENQTIWSMYSFIFRRFHLPSCWLIFFKISYWHLYWSWFFKWNLNLITDCYYFREFWSLFHSIICSRRIDKSFILWFLDGWRILFEGNLESNRLLYRDSLFNWYYADKSKYSCHQDFKTFTYTSSSTLYLPQQGYENDSRSTYSLTRRYLQRCIGCNDCLDDVRYPRS